MKLKLRPSNILIVGGGTGIGLATAHKLLDNGANSVILASRNINKLNAGVEELKKSNPNSKVYTISLDITKVKTHSEVIEETQKMLGTNNFLDGLVISSGVNFDGANWKGFNISEEDWDNVINTNLKGVFFLMRNFANYLHAYNRKGNICIISSISAHRDLLSVYQVSKNAISRIVHAYGKYLCERGVVLNCVEPGTTDTDMMPHLKEYTDGVRNGKPWVDNSIKRVIRPEEISEVIYYLMTNMGEILSGSCVLCGGGCKTISY